MADNEKLEHPIASQPTADGLYLLSTQEVSEAGLRKYLAYRKDMYVGIVWAENIEKAANLTIGDFAYPVETKDLTSGNA